MAKSPFRVEYEGKLPDITVVVFFDCKKCGREVRFTAEDEDPRDGSLRCACGDTIQMTEQRLSEAQRAFRQDLHRITDPLKDLSRRR